MVYIGQKGYTIHKDCLPIEEQNFIRKELQVTPFVPKSSPAKPTPIPVYRESASKFYVPRHWGTETFGPPDEIKIKEGTAISTPFMGALRETQKTAVNAFIKCAKKKGGGLLELYCGFGKTVCALYIISKLRKKTLIIVHKSFLADQWAERIRQFLPSATIGRIQGDTINTDADIVIGMLQSLSMRDYPISIFETFGLAIIDECHHIGAEVFSHALFKIVTKYMLGLSATMSRKDGMSKVFKMFIGDVVFSKKKNANTSVKIRPQYYTSQDEDFAETELNWKGNVQYSRMIKKLCEFNARSEYILDIIKDISKEDRHIMVIAHNKSLLKYLHDAIQHRNIASCGYYIGGMKQEALKETEKKKLVIATYAMAEEALDIKTLNTLIMCTPKTDVRQAIGRILRSNYKEPLVIDIVDQHDVFKRQWYKRRTFYKTMKYNIENEKKKKPSPLSGICLIDD